MQKQQTRGQRVQGNLGGLMPGGVSVVATPNTEPGALGGTVSQVVADATGYTAAGGDGTIAHWETDPEIVREQICHLAGSPITETEWAQYVPGAAYDPPCVAS